MDLINNRQGGRRRGRGGQRGQNLGGQPGNRQDNRQRGNAAQLLEKYKSLARDAQLAGDRVQTEYYLQYADHYFRVLGESRARFEDQRPQRGEDAENSSSDNELGFQHGDDEGEEEQVEASEEQSRDDRPERGDRYERGNRQDRGPRRFDRDEREAAESEEAERQRRMNGADDDVIPLDVLPPAIGADDPASLAPADEEEAPRPRRRSRAPRPAKDDDEVAPAA